MALRGCAPGASGASEGVPLVAARGIRLRRGRDRLRVGARRDPAVYPQRRSCDVVSEGAGEKRGGGGDVFGAPEAPAGFGA